MSGQQQPQIVQLKPRGAQSVAQVEGGRLLGIAVGVEQQKKETPRGLKMETQAYGARGWCLAPGLNGVVSRVSRLGQAPRRNDLAAYVTTRVA